MTDSEISQDDADMRKTLTDRDDVYMSIDELTDDRAVEIERLSSGKPVLKDRHRDSKWSTDTCSEHHCYLIYEPDSGSFVCPLC